MRAISQLKSVERYCPAPFGYHFLSRGIASPPQPGHQPKTATNQHQPLTENHRQDAELRGQAASEEAAEGVEAEAR